MVKKDKTDLSQYFDRETATPCKTCYKRDSCFIRPHKGFCAGHEPGVPWSETFNNQFHQKD